MTVISAVVGATTPSSARVVAKVDGDSARLAVATNPTMLEPSFYGPVLPDTDGVVSLVATGLPADTQHWWAVEVDTVLDEEFPGRFRTHPPLGQPADFTIAAATCAGSAPDTPGVGDVLVANRISNHAVFDAVREQDPLLFWHGGDIHYYDLGSGNHGLPSGITGASLTNYRRSYDDVLLQPRQHQLYREIPTAYVWDDHDWGPNDSDRTHVGAANAQQAYRERWPHYPLPDDAGGIYQSWQIGRILFISADVRSYRDPNGDPDEAGKTMLGAAQKAWMQQLLSTTSAEFLVWLMPDQWHRVNGTDNWFQFGTERSELVAMLGSLGWLDRMILIQGDAHALGMNSGATNGFGGFPIYQFAGLDSSPIGSAASLWDVGLVPFTRGIYGTVRFRDSGSSIEVSAVGWVMDTPTLTHTFSIQVASPLPPPEPPEPPAATARIRTRMVWLGCDLVTGRVIAELHDITGSVTRLIGAHTSAQLTLPIPLDTTGRAPLATVLQATAPADTMIVAVVNDLPIWAGIPLPRERGTEATMPLGCVTIEGYLDRRYVGDHDFALVDEALIMATLVGDAQVEGIGLTVDAPPTGRLRDRTYRGHDDATVYARLQELSQVADGPEWTVDLDWTTADRNAVAKILRIRPRIGVGAAAPPAVFRTTAGGVFGSRGGAETSYKYVEDLTDGRYANHVLAVGSGEGEDRVQGTPARDEAALNAGRPRWEMRIRPSTSITSTALLNEHAQAELGRRRHGALTWRIHSRWDAWPRYGVDWRLGDDIAWDLVGHGHPAGVRGQGRAIGVEIDPQAGVLSPILLDPTSDGQE